MYRYAQIDNEGYIVVDSYLSTAVDKPNMIPLEEGFDSTNKRWNGKKWEEYIPEPTPELPTELEQMEADIAYLKMIRLSK